MTYNYLVEFRDWFWDKFEEWRKGTTKGPAAFARFLGVSQPKVSAWLNGDYKPNITGISQLARTYPDIYDVLGVPSPDAAFLSIAQEIVDELARRGNIKPDSPEGRRIIAEVVARRGAKSISQE